MTATTDPPRIVLCPQCRTRVKWTPANPWRPFCSERCRTIDLGAWASETYRIEGNRETDDHMSEDDDAPR